MEFKRQRLNNGLEVVAEVNGEAHSEALGFFVRAGSRDETNEIAGVSHFLEHMAFKGTARRSAEDVNREFDEIGAHYNAFTSEENTVYYASVLPEHQGECIDLLADIMRPSLREEDFEMEKKVILEEIQMYLDQPPYGMDDRLKEICFGDHPIARSVLGTSESISDLKPDQMRSYFESRYEPSNIVVAAAGRVDFDALVKQLEKTTADWATLDAMRDTPAPKCNYGSETSVNPAATQQYLLLLGEAPHAMEDDRFAAKLLAMVVGDDSGSRMYWELVDPGKVESATLGHYEYEGVGMFFTWAACAPDDADDVLAAIGDLYQRAEEDGFSEKELEQAKNKLRARIVLSSERPRSRLFNVGGNWMVRREFRSTRDDLDSINAISIADLKRVVERYPLSKVATVAVGPREFHKPLHG